MKYNLLVNEEAAHFLKKLDRSVYVRIMRKLYWLRENADEVRGEGLRSNMAGRLKLREGDYRIIYKLDKEKRLVVVISIGHRSEIYKK